MPLTSIFQIDPTPESIIQLGAVGIALLVIKELIGLVKYLWTIKPAEPKEDPNQKSLRQLQIKIDNMEYILTRLYEWHNVKDEDGVMVWYVRRSLEDAIKSISTNIELQNKILEKQGAVLQGLNLTLDKVMDEVKSK